MKSKTEVVVVGAAIVDLPLRPVNRDVFDAVSYPIDQIAMTIGGDAINEATIIKRLGHQTRLVSCIGEDGAGAEVLAHCRKNGIDIDYLKVDPAKTTSINVGLVSDNGERIFITNRNGSLWKFAPDDIAITAVSDARILSFASIFNNPLLDCACMVKLFRRAKEQGMTICADMVKSRLGEGLADIREALSYVDYFFPNFDEASELTGQDDINAVADTFLACGVKNVIIKTGSKGSFIKNADGAFTVPAYRHANCIDTTGAGDNFASAFISALLEDRPLKECAMFANAVASVAVESIGATTGVQTRAQADERYKAYMEENR